MSASSPPATFGSSDIDLFRDPSHDGGHSTAKQDFAAFASRYKRRLILAFLLPVLLSVALAFSLVPKYAADAVMIIRVGPEYVYETKSSIGGQAAPVVPFAEVQKSEAAILGSDTLHRDVIRQIGLARLYPDLLAPDPLTQAENWVHDKIWLGLAALGVAVPSRAAGDRATQQLALAVSRFDDNLSIRLEDGSAVVHVGFQHPNAAVARDTLDALLRLYMQERRKVYSAQRAILAEEELRDARAQLLTAEAARDAFKADHDVANFQNQRDALLARDNAAEAESQRLAAEIADDTEKLATLDAGLNSAGSNVVEYTDAGGDAAYAAARTRVVESQAKLKLAEELYAPSSPVVQRARREVADMTNIMEASAAHQTQVVRSGRTLSYDTLQEQRMQTDASLKGAQARRDVVVGQVASLHRQLSDFESLDARYNNLEQQVTIDRDRVTQFSRQLDNARDEDNADRTEADAVRLVQQPMVSPQPVSTRRLVVVAGGLVGVLTMLLVGIWTEAMRKGFLTPEQLERDTGLPVLGVMPYRSVRTYLR